MLAILAACVCPAVPAEVVPLPPMAATERGAYRARDVASGAALWETEWVVTRATQDGRPVLHMIEDGAGTRADFPGRTLWSTQMTIDLWGADPFLSAIREVRDTQRVLEIEDRKFDYRRATGSVEIGHPATGESNTREIHLTAQTYPVEFLSVLLRLIPNAPDKEIRFQLVTHTASVVDMRANVVGRERVSVPAGTFDCYKIELHPTGLTGVIARLIMPNFYMWHTEAAPHFWVKSQGAEGGPGSREIVRELLRFSET
jgi:hypothetical protein